MRKEMCGAPNDTVIRLESQSHPSNTKTNLHTTLDYLLRVLIKLDCFARVCTHILSRAVPLDLYLASGFESRPFGKGCRMNQNPHTCCDAAKMSLREKTPSHACAIDILR